MKRIRRNVLACLCVVVCLGLAGQPQEDPNTGHMGRVIDWSYHHVVVSGSITNANLDRARGKPRILFHLAERNLASSTYSSGRSNTFEGHLGRSGFHPDPGRDGGHPGAPSGFPRKKANTLQRDRSVPLGAGSVAPNMFPAKFGFNPDAR